MYENQKKSRIGLWIALAVLLSALGYGTGMTLRAYRDVEIVELEGRSRISMSVYHTSESRGSVLSATEIYERIAPACVSIRTELTSTNVFGQVSTSPVTGTGFLTDPSGYIFTNYHVIEDALTNGLPFTVTLYDGRSYPGTVIGGDERSDVALVKIEAENLPYCELGDFGEVSVGQKVYAVGNPLGELSWTMTQGIVSAMDREISISSSVSIIMFQIDAAINSGNSGGPVVNDRGQVVGIASAKYKASDVEGLGFAIPTDDARKVIDDVLTYGYVRGRVMLGISVTAATRYGYEKGVYLTDVSGGSAAEAAGLKRGDVILTIGGTEINSFSDLQSAKRQWEPGDTVPVVFLRNGQTMTVSVTLREDQT